MEACYRHPDRPTGVSCSSCGRPICPDCMTSTPVGMRCPECARDRTRVKTMRTVEEPTATYVLIAINVLVGAGLMLGGSSGGDFGNNQLYDLGALSRGTVADGEWWRLVTSGFVHGAGYPTSVFLHLLFNMFALWVLGGLLEPAIGRARFLLIYFTSLLAGSFGALLLSPEGFTAGASGAVFGLMGAAVVIMRNRGISPMESGLGIWIVLNLVITFTIPNISIGGHIGGLVGGAFAALLLFDLRDRVRIAPLVPMALCAALAAAAAAGAIVVSAPA